MCDFLSAVIRCHKNVQVREELKSFHSTLRDCMQPATTENSDWKSPSQIYCERMLKLKFQLHESKPFKTHHYELSVKMGVVYSWFKMFHLAPCYAQFLFSYIFISFQKPRLSFSEILTSVPFIVQKLKDFNVTGTNCSFLSSKANDIVYWRLLSGRRKLKILKCFSRVILPVELQSIIVTKCSKVLWFSSVRSNQVIQQKTVTTQT